jgi:hypothetical protein
MISGFSGSPAETMRRIAGSGRIWARLASILYSVGAWHSTLTLSRSQISSRCDGSKRPSQSSAAAPHSHGATNVLRADFDQPGAAVHHARSPSRAPNQCRA